MSTANSISDARRNLAHTLVQQRCANVPAVSAIPQRASSECARLALSQEQLVIREQSAPRIPFYNESITLRFRRPILRDVLQSSVAEIIRRHEIWRTHYESVSGELVQVVDQPPDGFVLPLVDLRRAPEWRKRADLRTLSLTQTSRPFDLGKGPLLRFTLVAMSDSEYWLVMTAHQSVVDGISVYQVFPRELLSIYGAFSAGHPSPLADLPLQFSDFAAWQRAWLTPAESARQIGYWRAKLGGEIDRLRWPDGRPRPARRTFRGYIREFTLARTTADAAAALGRVTGATTFTVLLSAFYALLRFYTGQTDLVIGTLSPSGRKRSEVQALLGYFLNPVALRVDVADDPAFKTLLHNVQIALSEAISNDDVPFERVVEALARPADASRNPYFDVAISLQPCMPDSAGAWNITSMDAESGAAVLDFYLAFIDRPEGLHARVQYNPDIFAFEQIRQFIKDFEAVLILATANPDERITKLRPK